MKAIIIVDIPYESLDGWVVDYMEVVKYDAHGPYDMVEYCDIRLRSMPYKYEIGDEDEIADTFVDGWNSCIDEMLKENEDGTEKN